MRRLTAMVAAFVLAACSEEGAPAEPIGEVAAAPAEIAEVQPSPSAPKGKYAPRDECAKLPGAGAFRRELAAAVKAHDTNGLVALAADDVQLSFDDNGGKAQLRAMLTDYPEMWDKLAALLPLGCAADREGGMTIPWYFDQDIGDLDVFEAWLTTGEDVPLFRRPERTSERVGSASWDMVEITEFDPEKPYQKAKLADGSTGFIATDKLRSVIDYRLGATRRNGEWRITFFLAGD